MADARPQVGAEIGGHRLVRLIGRGGMGDVYEARDLTLGRRVAVKLLGEHLLTDAAAAERFQREIELAARVEHVGIVPVYAAGLDPVAHRFYISMRYIDGPDLDAQLSAGGRLTPDRAIRLLGQLGAALHAVHTAGLVHRDVKPHNVLLWAPGQPDEHALLTDFGIARARDEEARNLTAAGGITGTPPYIAPEIWLGSSAEPASDQYALACVAYRMLTGGGPLDHADGDWRRRHLHGTPTPLVAALAPPARDAITRALSKAPGDRFGSVRQFLDQLGGSGAFERSEAVTQILRDPAAVQTEVLTERFGLTETTVAMLTDVEPSEVIRQRRLAARRAVMGG